MEKIKAEENNIHSLYDKNGILQSKTANVLEIAEDYYSDLLEQVKLIKKMQNETVSKTKIIGKVHPKRKLV